MIYFASGMEERHTNNSRGVGGWAGAGGTIIHTADKNTGAASMELTRGVYVGSTPFVTSNKGWWSFASRQWTRLNGTYLYLFSILVDSTGPNKARYIGWYFNTVTSEYHLALFDGTLGGRLAVSSNRVTSIQFYEFKLEFDNGEWTLWSNLSGSWAEEFTYSDSTTGPYTLRMSLNFSTDTTKGGNPLIDDCVAWDEAGDNWNSRITAIDDFPHISVAHVLASPESDATQAVKLDEIPPAADTATVTETGYWATPPALDGSVTDTIQAVMVTHVNGPSSSEPATWADFNMREDGVLHEDSGEGGRGIMRGYDSGSPNGWFQSAAYYPWTFDEVEWTAGVFAGVEYGVSLIDTKSDQITVQAISFGSSHEWSPSAPPVTTFIPRVIMC